MEKLKGKLSNTKVLKPEIEITQLDDGVEISATDYRGTTTAIVHDGETGAAGPAGPAGPTGSDGPAGADGQRGGKTLYITTAPSSSAGTIDGHNYIYKSSLSTVKTQAQTDDVIAGDMVYYSYYTYPVVGCDDNYVYMSARNNIRGQQGQQGARGPAGPAGSVTKVEASYDGYVSDNEKVTIDTDYTYSDLISLINNNNLAIVVDFNMTSSNVHYIMQLASYDTTQSQIYFVCLQDGMELRAVFAPNSTTVTRLSLAIQK